MTRPDDDTAQAAVILTVTPNMALDVSYDVDALVPGASHRVLAVRTRAGGKGTNVARILLGFGYEVSVSGLVGGTTGDAIRADLAAAGLPESLTHIAADSRRTSTVVSRSTGEATLFSEPGPPVTDEEWHRLLDAVGTQAARAPVVVMSGSLPPTVPTDAYAQLVRTARAAGAMTIVDADGPALSNALAAGPDVVKPNAAELAAATGIDDRDTAATWLREHGARSVIATFGPEGLVAHTPDGVWRAWLAGDLRPLNPTGAGDACTAALAAGLADGRQWPEILVTAVAWSAASVLTPVAGDVDAAEVARLRPNVRVEEMDAPRIDR